MKTYTQSRDSIDFPVERRRHARTRLNVPVTVFCPTVTLEGVTVNESYTGILVQVMDGELPNVGEHVKVILQIMGEEVEAVGDIVRLVEEENQVAVDLTQLVKNGVLMLAMFPPL